MEQRQIDIEKLRNLRKEAYTVNQLATKLKETTQKISENEEIIREQENFLNNPVREDWKEVHSVHNADIVTNTCKRNNSAKSKKVQKTVCTIFVLVCLAIFVLSVIVLANMPETSWIKTSDYNVLFWISHIVLGTCFSLAPVVFYSSTFR